MGQHKVNVYATVMLVVALVTGLLVAVVRSEGFQETRVDLHDGAVWVAKAGRIGRVNTQARSIEVTVADGPGNATGTDLIQAGTAVYLTNPPKAQLYPVDGPNGRRGDERKLPASAVTQLSGDRGLLADPATGRVWLTTASTLTSVDPETTDPTFELDDAGEIVAALDVSGRAHVYPVGSSTIHTTTFEGEGGSSAVREPFDDVSITTVGTLAVLLDHDGGRLQVPGGDVVDLRAHGSTFELQEPGPAGDAVLVGTDEVLLSVPIGGGEPVVLATGGGGAPAPPVRLAPADVVACSYGAWSSSGTWARWCEGDEPATAVVFEGSQTGQRLRFRVNRDRVLLNNVVTGDVLPVDEQDPELIDNWDGALDREREQEDEDTNVEIRPERPPCREDPPAPKVENEEAGTRPDRPVVVPVLDSAQSDDCDVLVVELTDEGTPDPSEALVQVVDDGSAIQVTPVGDTTEVQVRYQVVGKGGPTPGFLRVPVTAGDGNQPPKVVKDRTVVEAGRTVQHNVLLNDSDPDGDALTLVGVSGGDRGGTVEFEANGRVTYTAPGGAVGLETLTYLVDDHYGDEPVEGTLEIQIQSGGANLPPKARNDRLVVTVGTPASIDLLANDTDPNEDPLTLLDVDRTRTEGLKVSTRPDGNLEVEASSEGRYRFPYEVSDGEHTVEGWVLVEARPIGSNSPPVAVRDDIVVRPGVPALVDLVANDIDEDGDVLAVTAVEVRPDVGVSVEILEMRVARVTASAALVSPAVVTYWVSDGSTPVSGRLLVRPLIQSAEDQGPIARDDVGSVRPGNTTAVPVLVNDTDPEGEQLTITDVRLADESAGTAFIQGDQLRFQASEGVRGEVVLQYDVEDPGGNAASATVRIEIIDPSRDNQPPDAPAVEGRAFAGGSTRIKVPLTGLDPDGDVVGIVGLTAEEPPLRGAVTVEGGALYYQADGGDTAVGVDTFTFVVADSHGATALGRARVVVAPRPTTNSPPVAVPDRVTVAVGETRVVPVLANDRDPDEDELRLLTGEVEGPSTPRLGEVSVAADGVSVEYRAPSSVDRVEQVSFTYGVTDGPSATRGVVLVEIHPDAPENEPPVAVDDPQPPQLTGTTGLVIDVLSNDRDVDDDKADLTVELLDPSVGTVQSDGSIRVDLGSTSLSFLYRLSDPAGGSSVALVSIPVVDALAPQPSLAVVEAEAGRLATIDLAAYIENPSGPSSDLSVDRWIERTVRGVTIESVDGMVVGFTPDTDWFGDAGFSYVVSNGSLPAVGAVRVRITGQDVPPTVRSVEVSLPAGGEREIRLQPLVTDPDTEEHDFELQGGAKGDDIALDLTGDVLRVRAGFTAMGESTEAELTVSDYKNPPVDFTIPITVDPNDRPPPVAVDDEAETDEGKSEDISVLDNDIDYIGEGLTVMDPRVVGASAVGSATTDGRIVTFHPAGDWFGTALVTYTIADASDRRAQGTIRINVFGRPGRPSTPSGEADSHQVRLRWGAPNRNGAPIQGYVVETEGGGREEVPNATSWTVTGLQNDVGYRFRVAALNRVVTSAAEVRETEWSDWSATYTPDAVPDQPVAPTAEFRAADNADGAGGVLHVSWSPPPVDGSPISEYRVTATPPPSGQTPTQTVPAGTTSLRWEGLANGVPHRFRVVAVNNAGESAASPDSTPETPAGIPAQVAAVSAERVADARNDTGGYASVSWGAVADHGDPGGLRYRVTISPEHPGGLPSTRETSGLRMEWSGLDVGANYSFTVVAFNKAGDAATSPASDTVNPEGKPDSPSAPRVEPGDGTVRFFDVVTTSEERRGPGQITYQYRFDTGGWYSLSVDGDGRASVNRGNGQTVNQMQVRACKFGLAGPEARQCGDARPATNRHTGAASVTPFAPPAMGVTPASNGMSATWRWTPPPSGMPTTTYNHPPENCGSGCHRANFSHSQRICRSVLLESQGVRYPSSGDPPNVCHTAPPPPPPEITHVSRGPGGSSDIGSCGRGAGCTWVVVHFRNFPSGSRQYSVDCHGGGYIYHTQTINGPSGQAQTQCLAGSSGSPPNQTVFSVRITGHDVDVEHEWTQ